MPWSANGSSLRCRPPHGVKPDLVVAVTEQNAGQVSAALTDAGLKLVEGSNWTVYSQVPDDRRTLEFHFGLLSIAQHLRRGAGNDTLVDLRHGANPLRLPLPDGLPRNLGWTGVVHTEIRGLPLAFPVSDELAGACFANAIASGSDAVAVAFGGEVSPIRTDITLPTYDVQLEQHLASVRLRAAPSPAGRIAEALLGRLADRQELDPLADPLAPSLLNALIAPSRLKLAQRVRQELERAAFSSVDEERLVALLRHEGLFLELQTRTLEQLASATSSPKGKALAAVAGLSDAGYLRRGLELRCPLCEMPDFWQLRELDERLVCRACRQEFPLPAREGSHETRTGYRLDGLVARALDQDLLGTFLGLRFLLAQPTQAKTVAWWPGLELFELSSTAATAEIDLLFAADRVLTVCEVKSAASGVDEDAAGRLVELADRIGAKKMIAAPAGEWEPGVVEFCAKNNVALCGPEELLANSET